jgi:hypothetical protein
MDRLRGAGLLWTIAALLAIVTTLVFRVDQAQIVATLLAGVIALGLGLWILLGRTGMAVPVSTALGVAWVVLFVALAVIQSDEIEAWSTDAAIAVFGGLAALLAYRTARA